MRYLTVERDEAIDIVLQTLRLERCPLVWAQHSNTRHPHLHLAIVRVDPVTQVLLAPTGSSRAFINRSRSSRKQGQRRNRTVSTLRVKARCSMLKPMRWCGMQWPLHYRLVQEQRQEEDPAPCELLNLRAELISIANEAQSWSELHQLFAEVAWKVRWQRAGLVLAPSRASTFIDLWHVKPEKQIGWSTEVSTSYE